jgi:DNA-binding response OmpR family regulator
MTDILIVEDNNELGTLIRDLLSREGYSVELLENGEMAILRLKEEDYKLMLLDVMLPGLDGF